MGVTPSFWAGKKVFVTGHTGFKGSWLCLWLDTMGADVTGYALAPPSTPSLFEVLGLAGRMRSLIADVRDADALSSALGAERPDVVLHLAAQSLVRPSYADPVTTYATNVMGTVNLLDAVRRNPGNVRAVVNITSDKCYENREWVWGYRESDALGGFDPYSNSKGAAELVTAGYRSSYFSTTEGPCRDVALASARAGNVIGGGDWAVDRLVPDTMRAFASAQPMRTRRPGAIRPWQHVLEPLHGYLSLAEQLHRAGREFAEAWNFGPSNDDTRSVGWIVERLQRRWGESARSQIDDDTPGLHEAHTLRLDCAKAHARLDWHPRWSLETALENVVVWYQAHATGQDMRELSLRQIAEYASAASR